MEASSGSTGREWSVSLIQTKMIAPRLPPGCVQRLALLKRIDAQRPHSIVVVTAPAGFGKTTLLAGWSEALSAKNQPVAWLSLDAEDDDPQQVGAYLVAAFSRASEDIAGQAQQLLNNDSLTPIRTVISVLLNGIAGCGRNVFLVLDDVDRLSAKPVLAVVSRLLRYAPENMHVLLGARAEPALALAQLRAPEKLMRINADDLRFSIDDAQSFFDRAGTAPLDRDSVELLNEATEGWVAGLQLASLALDRVGDAARLASNLAGPSSGIDRYLNDTVLAHLPPVMLKFLLHTSILERLGPGVCDAIMGRGGESGEKLDWLEQHNVFIQALDERQDWYRYHALLSDALRRRLVRQKPQEVPVLHRRACRWFAAERLWPEAVRHALAAGDLDLATQWVENCAIDMLERGDPYTLLGWIGKLPPDAVQGRLRLRIAKAWALAFSLQTARASREIGAVVDEFERVCREAGGVIDEAVLAEINAVGALIASVSDDSERALELGRAADVSGVSVAPWARRYAQSAQFFGLMHRGRFDQILELWNRVGNCAEASIKSEYSNMLRDGVYGLSAMVRGELPEARRLFEAIMLRAENALGASSLGKADLTSCLASIYYECNELDKARNMIAGRTTAALETTPSGALVRHVLSAARLLSRDGEMGSALAVLEDGRQVAIRRQWLRLKLACDTETVRLLIDDGNVARARQIADELSANVPALCEGRQGSAVETWTSYCVLQARVLMAENRAGEAVAILERLLGTVAALGWRTSEALVSLLLARAFEQCEDAGNALSALRRALRIGGTIGMVNSFVDEGRPVRELLHRFCRVPSDAANAESAYARRLLAAFHELDGSRSVSTRSIRVMTTSSNILSVRELEIVNCVALGLSNKEIGRSLKLAPETVKWHLRNIFEKLNVSSRIEAVQSVLGLGVGEGRAAM
ncbi:LuxR C-terminal-related transcriptional regulator [Paraburkholderia susongensis]|uniref:LuxR family transcriptional regulator, maltose regulon positive regulatory protein n=1 Tax=Paraburkholderia susongensis TaxID=1515439 RepID=A0A1X7LY70_9BURK|nr:LuxR C-terminal-related transcriptional regulator [Paraburkholderia susongensis]SMG58069.1 LuxR family transcriptional regulator, maltose regulon positive regulatory protein [Paraburkholderia susongensis]